MVKKLFKFVALLLFFIFALILFAPKENIYYLLEQNLKKFDIIISHEKLENRKLYLNIQNLDVSVKGIETLTIKEANIVILALYNSIELENIMLSSLAKNYLPVKIDKVDIYYTILNPLKIYAVGHGKFGDARVAIDVLKRKAVLVLRPSKIMRMRYRNSLKELKKSKNGEYLYEKSL